MRDPKGNRVPPTRGLRPPRPLPPPSVLPPPLHHYVDTGAMAHIQAVTRAASAPAVAKYNRVSGGTQGIVPGIAARDLREARRLGKQYPGPAEAFGSLVDPIGLGVGAVRGARQAVHGVAEAAHGQLGHGLADVGLGGLGVAAVLPVGRSAKLARALRGGDSAERSVRAALKRGDFQHVRDIAEATAPVEAQAQQAAKAALARIPKDVFRKLDITEHDFARHIVNGARARYWYEESAHGILRMAGGNKRLADKFAQVTAVMSAQKEPLPNIQLATRALHEFNTYGEVRTVGDEFQRAKANAILNGEAWEGVKTDRFYKNMLEDIDPAKYKRLFGNGEVTNDIWMARLYGLKSEAPTPREYKAMTEATQRAAEKLGWKPKHVQAAQWISVKEERQPRLPAGGASTFADALALEHASLPFEAAPGRNAAPGLHDAFQQLSQKERERYTNEKFKHVVNYLHDVGIMGTGGSAGPGVFEGAVNPGRAVVMAASRQKGPFKEEEVKAATGATQQAMKAANALAARTVQPEARVALDRVAASIGHALKQDAAAWYKPFFVGVKKNSANGLRVDMGKTITDDQARALSQALREAGHGDQVAIVHHPNGADFLSIDPSLSGKEFHKIVDAAFEKTDVPVKNTVLFMHDSNYIERGFYGTHTGFDQAAQAADGGTGEGARVGANLVAHERRHADALARLVEGSDSVDRRYFGTGAEPPTGIVGRLASESGELNLAAMRRVPVRTPEEAHAHLEEARAQARAQGFGGHPGGRGNPPIVEKGVSTEATGGDLGRLLRESLLEAPAIRKIQNPDISEERTARVRAAAKASVEAGGGTAGHLAAKRHLAGAYGREFFGNLKHLTPDEVNQLNRVVDGAQLQFFEKTSAKDAILRMVNDGVVPQPHDQALLERVFGRVAGAPSVVDEQQAKLAAFWDKFVQAMNIPRAIRSSMDISAGFRQGLMVLVTHPGIWAKAFGRMVREFGSQEFYDAQQEAIRQDPDFPLMMKYKLPLTDIHGDVPHTEEAFIGGQMAEKIPIAGHAIKASDRAFTGFQNGTRAALFSTMIEKAALMGEDVVDNPRLGESIAKLAGTFTGRGVTPKVLENHMTTLNLLMFSPRLMASRINMISPAYYAHLDPFARREALAGARNLVAAVGTVMVVAKLLGADVNFDPRSSDFAKVRVGDTRVDVAGGFSQYIRLLAQHMTGVKISSAGTRIPIKYPGQHAGHSELSTLANLTQFGRSKAAPIPSLLWDELDGKDFLGRPITQKGELWANAPFIVQDVNDARRGGASTAAAAAFLSAIGFGVQSYKPQPPKANTGLDLSGGLGGSLDLTGGK